MPPETEAIGADAYRRALDTRYRAAPVDRLFPSGLPIHQPRHEAAQGAETFLRSRKALSTLDGYAQCRPA